MFVRQIIVLCAFQIFSTFCSEIKFSLNNNEKIPAVGLGTWQAKNEEELISAVDVALETGYRHIDTAFVYLNEPYIGKALKKWFDSGKLQRKDIFITSKLPFFGLRPEKVQKYINKTLSDLQIEYLDMYLVHVPFGAKEKPGTYEPLIDNGTRVLDLETDHIAIWKEMEKLVDMGLTKSIGLSNFNQTQIKRVLDNSRIPPSNLQIEHHLYLQQKELTQFCKDNNIVVTAYSPLGSPGLKSLGFNVPNVLSNPSVTKIAENHNKTAAQVLIRHIIQRGIVAIPKSVHAERIRQNFDVFDFELTKDEIEELNSLDKGFRLLDFEGFFTGISKHPEYPFPRKITS